jgi:hypothetical protein
MGVHRSDDICEDISMGYGGGSYQLTADTLEYLPLSVFDSSCIRKGFTGKIKAISGGKKKSR